MIKFRKKYILLLILISVNIAAADIEGIDILKMSDEKFFPGEARFIFRMEDYEGDEFKRYYLFEGYVKGLDRYILIGLEPAVNRGHVHLRVDDIIFSYLKKIDRIKQVSANVAFHKSMLSQEDVLSMKLSNFYNVESCRENIFDDEEVYVLELAAKSNKVAYHKVVCYIDKNNLLPVKREYFSYSGHRIKEMLIDEIIIEENKLKALRLTMVNSLYGQRYTKVFMEDFDYSQPIPDLYFSTASMKILAR